MQRLAVVYNIILPVKPKYAAEILAGRKKYEYRKSVFKKEVNKVYIYAGSPQKRIVGYFFYNQYIMDTPENIWKLTRTVSGIGETDFFDYFNGRENAFALKIDQFYPFADFLNPFDLFADFCAPQSYKYIEKDIDNV